jgi:hypothetical protein
VEWARAEAEVKAKVKVELEWRKAEEATRKAKVEANKKARVEEGRDKIREVLGGDYTRVGESGHGGIRQRSVCLLCQECNSMHSTGCLQVPSMH